MKIDCAGLPSGGTITLEREGQPRGESVLRTLAVTSLFVAFLSASPAAAAASLDVASPATTLSVPGNGLEAFTEPLERGVYTVTVTGIVPIVCEPPGWFTHGRVCEADALYAEDESRNFTERHGCLRFGLPLRLLSEDRATHTYTFRLLGTGKRLSAKITCPFEARPARSLTATLEPTEHMVAARLFGSGTEATRMATVLLDGGPAGYALLAFLLVSSTAVPLLPVVARWAREAKARREREIERLRKEEEARHAEEQRKADEVWLLEMRARYEHMPQDEDPAFLRALAEQLISDPERRDLVIADWYNRRKQVVEQLLQLHADGRRIDLLRERAPHIYERAVASARVLEQVERLAATHIPKPAAAPPRSVAAPGASPAATPAEPVATRRKVSIESYRESLVQRVKVAAEDQIVLQKTRFQLLDQARQELGAQGVPDDEISGALQGISDAINEALTGKKGAQDVAPL